jgi:hypothetical protein
MSVVIEYEQPLLAIDPLKVCGLVGVADALEQQTSAAINTETKTAAVR